MSHRPGGKVGRLAPHIGTGLTLARGEGSAVLPGNRTYPVFFADGIEVVQRDNEEAFSCRPPAPETGGGVTPESNISRGRRRSTATPGYPALRTIIVNIVKIQRSG